MAEQQEIQETPNYRTLDEIRLRKAQLLTGIAKDSNHIQSLWNRLFHKTPQKGKKSTGRRLSGIMSTSASVIDGIILGWKLYRKFRR